MTDPTTVAAAFDIAALPLLASDASAMPAQGVWDFMVIIVTLVWETY